MWESTRSPGGRSESGIDPPILLREILRQRVRDGVVLRLIGKWLKAGVLDNGLKGCDTKAHLKLLKKQR